MDITAATPTLDSTRLRDFSSAADTSLPSSSYSENGDSSLISSTPLPIVSASSELGAVRESFLANLSNYLPLGCLFMPNHIAVLLDPRPRMLWHEVLGLDYPPEGPLWELHSTIKSLLDAKWIKVFSPPIGDSHGLLRIYVLPQDVGQRFVCRNGNILRSAFQRLLLEIDVSPEMWAGNHRPVAPSKFDPWASADRRSLFYLFNSLPSPDPSPELIQDRFTRAAVEELLDSPLNIPGLKTKLYPYQARSAAVMMQREAAPQRQLDPRLEPRSGPEGQTFYYAARDSLIFREPRLYESNRGGILAETMGLGKTLICIAVILATQHHFPKIPPEYRPQPTTRKRVGSLSEMAAANIARNSLPWKLFFKGIEDVHGYRMDECIKHLESVPPEYEIPAEPPRRNRKTTIPASRRLTLCSGTIIVVPRNLLHQWQTELKKHVVEGQLNVLHMDSPRKPLPPASELRKYDIVLFSRPRFEQEIKDGTDSLGNRLSSRPQPLCRCVCPRRMRALKCHYLKADRFYTSPLKELHWLRIIIDEGHSFSSSRANAVLVAEKLVQAERRWVVSGTPARDLFGVEVDIAANDGTGSMGPPTLFQTPLDDGSGPQLMREALLEQRRYFDSKEDTAGAIKNLGSLASNFLKVQPWNASNREDRADWDEHIFRHEQYRQRTYSAFSTCLESTLTGLVVKTRPEDVERDIDLPPLRHQVVYLKPCFFDKLTVNLFILVLTANAVTSERVGVDYLFHKNNQRTRYHLITNLRQSNFFWTGFSEKDVLGAIENSKKYLAKESTCSLEDRHLLEENIRLAQMALSSHNWRAMSATHEIGLFVDEWPECSAQSWSLGQSTSPRLSGATLLLKAQGHVNAQLTSPDPTEGLEAAGEKATVELYTSEDATDSRGSAAQPLSGVPPSSIVESKRHHPANTGKRNSASSDSPKKQSPKKRRKNEPIPLLPEDSPLRRTAVIGTASAKLSYLLGQVMAHYTTEKILIFYDGENTAYYIAQCLELLDVKYLIYAKTLSNEARSKYIVAFDQDESIRVLLMDIRCGALGLNVNKASRVYFINPVCRPSIEAQAIKRAHRIGQSREVTVETLILKGTIEEAIFQRSKAMTRTEHLAAKTLEDDQKIIDIIQQARPIPVDPADCQGAAQFARLRSPQQLFGRPTRGNSYIEGIDADPDVSEKVAKKRVTLKLRVSPSEESPGAEQPWLGRNGVGTPVPAEPASAPAPGSTLPLFGGD